MTARRVRFNRPAIGPRELDYVRDALARPTLSADGAYTARCQDWLRARLGAARVLLTHSATAALEMAAILAGLGPGDEAIMPAFTFASTANAVVLRGATPVFVDIRADTLNLDPSLVEAAISPRTRAIVPVHYAGVPCDMAAIADLARRHELLVIEDAAQALLSSYRGRPAGALGDLAAMSFHDTKNVVSGEGGALVVNRADLVERALVIRQKGTNRDAFRRGRVDHYTWVDIGSSFAPSEVTAALLLAQLESADAITAERRGLWARYHSAFAALEAEGRVRRPAVPDGVEHNGHLFHLLLPDRTARDGLIAALARQEITAPFHFVPLDDSPAGRRFARAAGPLPVTHDSAARLIRLPLWPGMTWETDYVVDAVTQALRA